VLDSGWRELAEYSLDWLRSKHLRSENGVRMSTNA
jgi:hypothetical protein